MSVVTHTGVEEKLTNEGSHCLKTSANDVSHTKGVRGTRMKCPAQLKEGQLRNSGKLIQCQT